MSKFTPEQLMAMQHDSGNILVSASAGSGKTYVMIERILRIILQKKASVEQILAVTFTSAAAEEMKEKLKKALAENSSNDEFIKTQLKLLPSADISTIHSFCANILRTHFFYLDISPDFEILDQVDSNKFKLQALDNVFERLYESACPNFTSLAAQYKRNRSDKNLKDLILSLYSSSASRLNFLPSLRLAHSNYSWQGFLSVLEDICALQRQNFLLAASEFEQKFLQVGGNITSNNAAYASEMLQFLQDKLNAQGFENYYMANTTPPKARLLTPKNAAQLPAHQAISTARELIKNALKSESAFIPTNFDMQNEYQKFLQSGETAQKLVNLLQDFEDEYTRIKLKENKLDYEDLQHLAIKVLQNKNVQQSVASKYKYIFVDEYQDVNQVQEEILNLIATDNVFMVGDLKQSIYAFRGCDPEFFKQKQQHFEKGFGASVYLNNNFRSSHGVINAVNGVFNKIMTTKTSGIDYKNKAQLIAGGLYPDNCGNGYIHLLPQNSTSVSLQLGVYDIANHIQNPTPIQHKNQSIAVANIISSKISQKYFDIKDNTYKQIEFSDIAVLARNRNSFDDLTAVLDKQGIPYVTDNKKDLFSYNEIAFLILTLRFIDNQMQDIPLAAVLKYTAELDEDSLSKIKLAYLDKTFTYACQSYAKDKQDHISQKLNQTFSYFNSLQILAEYECAKSILEKVLNDFNLRFYFAAQNGGSDKVARIERFLLEAVSGNKKLSCIEFLHKIDNYNGGLTFNTQGLDNAVNLVTIHKSKGLEYPIVILIDCGKDFVTLDEKNEVYSDQFYGICPKYFDQNANVTSETALRRLIKLQMQKDLTLDEMRVFYVALTRAKYELHIVCDKQSTKPDCAYTYKTARSYSDFLVDDTIFNKPQNILINLNSGQKTAKNVLITQADDNLLQLISSNLNYKYPNEQYLNLPEKVSVAAAAEPDFEFDYNNYIDSQSPSSTLLGNAYHKALELYNFNSPINAASFLDKITREGLIDSEYAKQIDLNRLSTIVNMPIFLQIANMTIYKEREFFVSLPASIIYNNNAPGDILVQGVIDMVCEDESGNAIIIDYKYSRLNAIGLELRYKKQLLIYKAAYEQISGNKVNRLVLVNLLSGDVINVL